MPQDARPLLAVRDPELGRPVAAKVMRDDTPGPARERCLREARLTGQLEHPRPGRRTPRAGHPPTDRG